MGLTEWKGAPSGKIQKFDLIDAKNYLTQNEMAQVILRTLTVRN